LKDTSAREFKGRFNGAREKREDKDQRGGGDPAETITYPRGASSRDEWASLT